MNSRELLWDRNTDRSVEKFGVPFQKHAFSHQRAETKFLMVWDFVNLLWDLSPWFSVL